MGPFRIARRKTDERARDAALIPIGSEQDGGVHELERGPGRARARGGDAAQECGRLAATRERVHQAFELAIGLLDGLGRDAVGLGFGQPRPPTIHGAAQPLGIARTGAPRERQERLAHSVRRHELARPLAPSFRRQRHCFERRRSRDVEVRLAELHSEELLALVVGEFPTPGRELALPVAALFADSTIGVDAAFLDDPAVRARPNVFLVVRFFFELSVRRIVAKVTVEFSRERLPFLDERAFGRPKPQ